MCDHKMRFLDIFVGYPGSVHDSCVLKNSPFFTQQKYPPQGYYILADGGYPCLSQPVTIITPYREPVNDPAKRRLAVVAVGFLLQYIVIPFYPILQIITTIYRFNWVFFRGRCIIERAFGVMKSRWRSIYFKALEVHYTFAPKVIACCCVLHNICIDNKDTVEVKYKIMVKKIALLTHCVQYKKKKKNLGWRVQVRFFFFLIIWTTPYADL